MLVHCINRCERLLGSPRYIQFPEYFVSSVAGSRGGRLFPLLQEDLSSVELKHTRDPKEFK
jgi:hypothetical protein